MRMITDMLYTHILTYGDYKTPYLKIGDTVDIVDGMYHTHVVYTGTVRHIGNEFMIPIKTPMTPCRWKRFQYIAVDTLEPTQPVYAGEYPNYKIVLLPEAIEL